MPHEPDLRGLDLTAYARLTAAPEALPGLASSPLATTPLPGPFDDPTLPPVVDAVAGDLAPVTTFGLQDLAAYAAAGWPGALPISLVRPEIGERLAQLVDDHLPAGFGLAVFDAWRPLALQQTLYDTLGDAAPLGYISPPSSDPTTPPPHLTGATVDLTLTFGGRALALGTDFDHFGPRAHPDALEPEGPSAARDLRRLLVHAAHRSGFVVHHLEWWHLEHGTARWAALTGGRPRYGPVHPRDRGRGA